MVAPPAPAPLAITVTVDPNATFDRADGFVRLHGTVACSGPVRVAGISGDLSQQQKKGTASGYFNQVSVADCNATPKRWDASTTLSSALRFIAGDATAQVRAAASDDFYTNYFEFPHFAETATDAALSLRNG